MASPWPPAPTMMTSYSCLRLGRGPLLLPALVAAHRLARDGEYRIFPHRASRLCGCRPGIRSLDGARCITSETALPPLRCLRRRLPFCAAGFGWPRPVPICDHRPMPATRQTTKDAENVQPHQQGRHRHRRQLRHRPRHRKAVCRAKAPSVVVAAAARPSSTRWSPKSRTPAARPWRWPATSARRSLCQGPGRAGRRANSAASTSPSTMPASLGEMGADLRIFAGRLARDASTTNLTSAFLGAKYQVPAMLERGGGSLIFTSTFVGHTRRHARHDGLCRQQGRADRADAGAGRRIRRQRHPRQRAAARRHRHAGQRHQRAGRRTGGAGLRRRAACAEAHRKAGGDRPVGALSGVRRVELHHRRGACSPMAASRSTEPSQRRQRPIDSSISAAPPSCRAGRP